MQLQRLTGLEIEKIKDEYNELLKTIEHLKSILESVELRMQIIKDELAEIKEKYGDESRSKIEYTANDFRVEDTIPDEDMVITISHMGYIKRTPLVDFRTQSRGGMGSKGSVTREEDFVEYLFHATNHNYLMFFTEQGKCFWKRVFEIPEGSKNTKGRPIQNLINITVDDKIKAFIKVKDLTDQQYIENNFIIFGTKKGIIKKTTLESYSRPRANGINAITIREDDELLAANLTSGNTEILIAAKNGKAIRFHESSIRPSGRNASGVKGITLNDDKDEVVSMVCVDDPESSLLVVSEKGFGKRSFLNEYRITNRGGKGVKTMNVTEKTGSLIAMVNVADSDDLMIINKSGITIRLSVESLRNMGRATQGVKLINLKNSDKIAAVAKIQEKSEDVTDEEIPDQPE
ncbi:MAG: DNA gyrase C-terminal beta-propeller domain-containing protein, partial [Bacteroidales bacterium]